jgi:hypothetical protein
MWHLRWSTYIEHPVWSQCRNRIMLRLRLWSISLIIVAASQSALRMLQYLALHVTGQKFWCRVGSSGFYPNTVYGKPNFLKQRKTQKTSIKNIFACDFVSLKYVMYCTLMYMGNEEYIKCCILCHSRFGSETVKIMRHLLRLCE